MTSVLSEQTERDGVGVGLGASESGVEKYYVTAEGGEGWEERLMG